MNKNKAPLIEINKRGMLAAIGSEGILIITILLIFTRNPPANIIDIIMNAFLLISGAGMAIIIFIETMIIQQGENKNISASNDPI